MDKEISNMYRKCFQLVYSLFDVTKMINMGNAYIDKIVENLTNHFWKDVLKYYRMYINKIKIRKPDDVLDMPLFYNNSLKIGDNSFYEISMYERGIRFIRDILCTSGQFKSKQEIEACTGKHINFLFYEGLKRSVAIFIKNSRIQLQVVKFK